MQTVSEKLKEMQKVLQPSPLSYYSAKTLNLALSSENTTVFKALERLFVLLAYEKYKICLIN